MSLNLLLVDDDQAGLYALSEMLSVLEANQFLAKSGEEALRLVLKHSFDAILLDVRMPRMDGFEVAAAIRTLERSRRTPIVFMSAEEDRRTTQRPAPAEEHYLRKPLAPELVLPTLRNLLCRPAAA